MKTRRPPTKSRGGRVITWAPYAFAAAAAGYLLVFTAIPLLRGVQLGFTDTRLLNPVGGEGTGLHNYSKLLADSAFWSSVWTTLVYTAGTVAGSLFLGTGAALLVNRAFAGRTLARVLLTLPWAVPTVAAALLFRWIYNDQTGVANSATRALGIGAQGWLTDPSVGMIAVLGATIWKVTPLVMLVVLAALQSIPDELYESTRIDGADALSAFRAVAWPALLPTLRVVALLMTIWSFRRFEVIWLLTGGGPADATNTLVINVYRTAFSDSRLGMAAAIGVLGLVLSLAVTVVYFVAERRSERTELRAGGAA
ncbi:sugar ABC transporter permease [Actinomadura vinacea]|uniref:Sugar ABC transporter permease n=1 Tax=Actinomadura vinacea TaxID=115336 RepID=A0ABN3ID46_9ACTN